MKSIMITFESIYTKKIGGLSEVPPRLGEALLSLGIDVELFTPSHASVDACSSPVFTYSLDGVEYCISKLDVKPVHYVVGGGVLDNPVVYPAQGLHEKVFIFGRVLYEYFSRIKPSGLIVFHGHDWHSIPALVGISKLMVETGLRAGTILHFHLGTRNIVDRELFHRYLGLSDDTLIKGARGILRLGEYYERSHGIIERLGALLVDKVVTVSKGYVKRLLRVIGVENSERLGYVFNATPFTWDEASRILTVIHGVTNPGDIRERLAMRREFLTSRLSKLVLRQTDQEVEVLVNKALEKYGLIYNRPFKSDGPTIFMVGRLSKQKGFDYIARVLDVLTLEEPRLRILVAGIPSQFDDQAVKSWLELAISYEENLRFLPGVLGREDLILLYYVSNLTLVPSRVEPFGLVALESLATGTPVAASKVDGLADIVIDIRHDDERGNGVLFPQGDLKELTSSVLFLLRFIEASYREQVKCRIRENAIERASEFSWNRSAIETHRLYQELIHT